MDNLKAIVQYKNEVIDPDGGPQSILAVDHNNLEDQIIKQLGRYTGLTFISGVNVPVGVVPLGYLYWGGNALNNTASFVLTTSGKTIDGTPMGTMLSTLTAGSIIKFKDFVGRTAIFEFVSYATLADTEANPYYTITMKGFAENPNYTYAGADLEPAIIEFYAALPSTPPESAANKNIYRKASAADETDGGFTVAELVGGDVYMLASSAGGITMKDSITFNTGTGKVTIAGLLENEEYAIFFTKP